VAAADKHIAAKGSLKMDKYRFRLPFSTPIFCQSRRFAAYHEQGQAPAPHAHNYFRLPTIAPAPVMRANPLHPYKMVP